MDSPRGAAARGMLAQGGDTLNAATDATLRRIDLTVARLMLTHDRVPLERRPGYLAARKRLRLARVRRFQQLQ